MAKLGELISPAKVKRCGGGSYPVLSMTMHDGIVYQAGRFKKAIASQDTSSYKVVNPGQLVVGFPIDEGVIYVQNYDEPGIMSPAYNVWDIDSSKVLPEYLELALHSPQSMAYYAEKMRGTTARRRSMTPANLCALELPVPEMSRQIEIVETLRLTKKLALVGKLQIETLDNLVKSRFVEMFGDPVINQFDWPVSSIKETALKYGDGPFGSNLKSSHYVDSGVRVIRLGNIAQGSFVDSDRSFISCDHFEKLKKYECLPGQIVIATLGDPVLRACLVPDFGVPSIHKADCMYYEVDESRVLPLFAMCAINHPTMLRRACDDAHGQTRSRINSSQTGQLPMILPPLELQREFTDFVRRVDKLKFANQMKDAQPLVKIPSLSS